MKAQKHSVFFGRKAGDGMELRPENKLIIPAFSGEGMNFYFLKSEVTLYGMDIDNIKGTVVELDGTFIFTISSPFQIKNNLGKILTKDYVRNFYSSQYINGKAILWAHGTENTAPITAP